MLSLGLGSRIAVNFVGLVITAFMIVTLTGVVTILWLGEKFYDLPLHIQFALMLIYLVLTLIVAGIITALLRRSLIKPVIVGM